jgi:hypothetical protein
MTNGECPMTKEALDSKADERIGFAAMYPPPLGASGHCHQVAAGILPAVEGGILPPGGAPHACGTAIPPGKMPGSTAGKMPAATAQVVVPASLVIQYCFTRYE